MYSGRKVLKIRKINEMMKKIILCITSIFFLCGHVSSQTDSMYNCMIGRFRIYQNEKGKNKYYEFEKKWNIVSVNDSFFIADPKIYSLKVKINDIPRISFHHGPDILRITAITGFAGFAIGFLIAGIGFVKMEGSSDSFNFPKAVIGGLLTGALFTAAGGVIGLLLSNDETFEFKSKDLKTKRRELINSLMQNRLMK